MSIFHLTIAEDELEKRAEGFQNLRSMLYGFIAATAIATASGFWYQLVPKQMNWNASQSLLVVHLAAGAMALFLFSAFLVLHMRQQQQRMWWLFSFWRLRKAHDEEPGHFIQRLMGFILAWTLLSVLISGVLISVPGLLYYGGVLWMQGYALSQLLVLVHLVAALLVPLPLLVHLLWKPGRKVN